MVTPNLLPFELPGNLLSASDERSILRGPSWACDEVLAAIKTTAASTVGRMISVTNMNIGMPNLMLN